MVIEVLKSLNQVPSWLLNMLPFEKQVKYIRKRLGVSQKILAEKVGTSQSGIGNIEAGKGNPTIHTIEKIAKELNCTLKVLFIPNQDINNMVSKDFLDDREDDIPQKREFL